jgi:transcriptional regulator of acetoin/glycerol metabolism
VHERLGVDELAGGAIERLEPALAIRVHERRRRQRLVAEHFCISRNTLCRKVKRHGIPLPNR